MVLLVLRHRPFQPGDLVVAVIAFAFFQGCSRACQRTLAPLGQPGDRDIRLPRYQFQRLAAQQSPSCAEQKSAWGPFPSTPEGAPTRALGERSGAPSGLRPSSFVMCNTPVEVQFPQPGVSIVRAAPQSDTVPGEAAPDRGGAENGERPRTCSSQAGAPNRIRGRWMYPVTGDANRAAATSPIKKW